MEQTESGVENLMESSKDLQEFRQEIATIIEKEKSGELRTGHFTHPPKDDGVMRVEDLGLHELVIWKVFKSCEQRIIPAETCLRAYNGYQRSFMSKDIPPVVDALLSFLGNKFNILSMRDELSLKSKKEDSKN
jgi:hypothetical protein